MPNAPQSYARHRRIDPSFHGVIFAIFFLNFCFSVVWAVRTRDLIHLWQAVLSLGLLLFALKLRAYSLHNQDRIIRLEERLRLEKLLPEDLKARIPELRVSQLVGLRFASDGEAADRVREALAEDLGLEAIKQRIQTWRPDHFRV